jgi:hypothetical protein
MCAACTEILWFLPISDGEHLLGIFFFQLDKTYLCLIYFPQTEHELIEVWVATVIQESFRASLSVAS